jgi:hypothetical protein
LPSCFAGADSWSCSFSAAGNRPAFLKNEDFYFAGGLTAGSSAGKKQGAFASVFGEGGGAFELDSRFLPAA